MKIRNGFVSNSSSSSFIIGYGVVKDKEKLLEYLDTIKELQCYEDDSWEFITPNNIQEKIEEWDWNSEYGDEPKPCHKLLVHAGNDITLEVPDKLYDKELFVVHLLNNEEDGPFIIWNSQGDDYNRLAWEKAEKEDWYPENQQKLINLMKNKDGIFETAEYKIGAERNG